MPYELIENDHAVMIHGACFIDELVTKKQLVVDGDLVAERVQAPSIELTHGSLVAKQLACDFVTAEILGTYELTKPFASAPGRQFYSYTWLRPVLAPLDATKWEGADSVEGVLALLESPAIVATPHEPTTALLAKIRKRPTCGRARVLVAVALETLMEHDAFTSLGKQAATPMLACGLPKDWRW